MTILAKTNEYLVEFEGGILTIARRTDGYCKAMTSKGIADQFRTCLATHPAERVIETFLRLAATHEWKPLYKADAAILKN